MIELTENQYINLSGKIITVDEDFTFTGADILEESEYYDEEDNLCWCARYATEPEESVWLNEDGQEVIEAI